MPFAAQAGSNSSGVPIGATSRAVLLSQVAFVRDVPGYPGAFVVRGALGEQLFADRRALGAASPQSGLRAMWTAAFHKPLPAGYQVVPAPEPPGVVYLVVIAIIAILIGMLLPAVQTVRQAGKSSPNGLHLVAADPSVWANIMVH